MKRLGLCLLTLMFLTACSAPPPQDVSSPAHRAGTVSASAGETETSGEDILVLSNKSFAMMVNQVYAFPAVYVGKTIQFSGIFNRKADSADPEGAQIPYVIQEAADDGHGHGSPGFEIICENDYPEEGKWVKVTGTLEYVLHSGFQFLRVRVSQWEEISVAANFSNNPHAASSSKNS